MPRINEAYIICVDICDDDIAVITVGRRKILTGNMEVVNTITGEKAIKMYEELTNKNLEGRKTHED